MSFESLKKLRIGCIVSLEKVKSTQLRASSRYKAKYVNGMKIFIAFISSTANRITITTAKSNALNGVVAELTWRRILKIFRKCCIKGSIPYGLQEYKPVSVIMRWIPNLFIFT